MATLPALDYSLSIVNIKVLHIGSISPALPVSFGLPEGFTHRPGTPLPLERREPEITEGVSTPWGPESSVPLNC